MASSLAILRLLLFLPAMALAGCSIGLPERTAPRAYVLNPEIPVKRVSANPGRKDSALLLVTQPKAQPGYDTPRMAYLLRPHEVSYYALNQWADTPGRMLVRLIAQAMERTDLWRAVVQAPNAIRADYRLDCDSLALEQEFFSNPSRVRLALRAQLIDIQQQSVMDANDFEIFEVAPTGDAYGGVIAANRAAAKLLEEMAAWVTAVMSESRASNRVIGTKGE
jgi:cholesterol transport system auxiliary component